MDIISRTDATALGMIYYFTGKPCKKGHVSERVVSSAHCCECRRIYIKNYNHVNKSRISKAKKATYQQNKNMIAERNKERVIERREYNRKYYIENKTKENIRAKKWKNDNNDHVKDYGKKWYELNKEHVLSYNKQYRLDNPDQYFIRRSLDRILTNWNGDRHDMEVLHGYSMSDLKEHIQSQFKEGMTWCKRSEWHIDHIIPISWWLSQGITDPSVINSLDNLQPLWATDNLKKGSK